MARTRRQILDALQDGPVTGPALATALDISRSAVWKHIEALRDAGFTVESGPDGYELTATPEFGGLAVAAGLSAPYRIVYEPSVASTNAYARDIAQDGADRTVVLADEQTGGRGRLDRSWASPSGGIWLSILLRPSIPPAVVPRLTLGAAVAIAETLQDLDAAVGIKWPNDVLTTDDERKVAGILTEMEGEADRVSWVIVGIGLNANIDPAALPSGATSLRALIGDVNRAAVTRTILDRFHTYTTTPDRILSEWRAHALTLGRRVRIHRHDETIVGQAVDITDTGALQVDTGETVVTVTAGDCEHLRPVE